MLKIKDKFIDHSENVECAIDRVSLGGNNQIVVQHRLSIGVTFKDWWRYITGKDCIHVTTKTIIEYEEDNITTDTDNTNSDKPSQPKKSKKSRKSKDTNTQTESSDSK